MNTLLGNEKFVFNPAARTITFTQFSSVLLQSVYAVFNVTDGICIYDFGDPSKGATVAGNVMTLTYDTTSMAATDSLLIKWDDGNIMGVDIPMRTVDDSIPFLRRIVKLLEASGNADVANRQRVTVEAITGTNTLTTVTTVTNVGNIGTLAGQNHQMFADPARIAYNTGPRAGLIFS